MSNDALRAAAANELHAALGQIYFSDFTLPEIYGLLAIVEPVRERAARVRGPRSSPNKAAVLRLVPGNRSG